MNTVRLKLKAGINYKNNIFKLCTCEVNDNGQYIFYCHQSQLWWFVTGGLPTVNFSKEDVKGNDYYDITVYNVIGFKDISGSIEDEIYEIEVENDNGTIAVSKNCFNGMSNLQSIIIRGEIVQHSDCNGSSEGTLPVKMCYNCNSLKYFKFGKNTWNSLKEIQENCLDRSENMVIPLKYFGPEQEKDYDYSSEDIIYIPTNNEVSLGDNCFGVNIDTIDWGNAKTINLNSIRKCTSINSMYFHSEKPFNKVTDKYLYFNYLYNIYIDNLETWLFGTWEGRVENFYQKAFSTSKYLYIKNQENNYILLKEDNLKDYFNFNKNFIPEYAFFYINFNGNDKEGYSESYLDFSESNLNKITAIKSNAFYGARFRYGPTFPDGNNIVSIGDSAFDFVAIDSKDIPFEGASRNLIFFSEKDLFFGKKSLEFLFWSGGTSDKSSLAVFWHDLKEISLVCNNECTINQDSLVGYSGSTYLYDINIVLKAKKFNITRDFLNRFRPKNKKYSLTCPKDFFIPDEENKTSNTSFIFKYWAESITIKEASSITITEIDDSASLTESRYCFPSLKKLICSYDDYYNYFVKNMINLNLSNLKKLYITEGPKETSSFLSKQENSEIILEDFKIENENNSVDLREYFSDEWILQHCNDLYSLKCPTYFLEKFWDVGWWNVTDLILYDTPSKQITNWPTGGFAASLKVLDFKGSANTLQTFTNNNVNFSIQLNGHLTIEELSSLNYINLPSKLSRLVLTGEQLDFSNVNKKSSITTITSVCLSENLNEIKGSFFNNINMNYRGVYYQNTAEDWINNVSFDSLESIPSQYLKFYTFQNSNIYERFREIAPKNLTIPQSNKNMIIKPYQYAYWTWLEKIDIKINEGSIGQGAFAYSGITKASLKITENTYVESNLFEGCDKLDTLTLNHNPRLKNENNDDLEELTDLSYYFNNNTKPENLKVVFSEETDDLYKFTSLNAIFSGFSNIISLSLPNTLTTIVENALAGLEGLTELVLPSSITSTENIGLNSSNLTNLTAPLGVLSQLNLSGLKQLNINGNSNLDEWTLNWSNMNSLISFSFGDYKDENGDNIFKDIAVTIGGFTSSSLQKLDLRNCKSLNITGGINITTEIDSPTLSNCCDIRLPNSVTFNTNASFSCSNSPITYIGPKDVFEKMTLNTWYFISLWKNEDDNIDLDNLNLNYTQATLIPPTQQNPRFVLRNFCPTNIVGIYFKEGCYMPNIYFGELVTSIPDNFLNISDKENIVNQNITIGTYSVDEVGAIFTGFSIPYISQIGLNAFNGITFNEKELIIGNQNNIDNIIIGDQAFSGSNLENIQCHTNDIGTAFTDMPDLTTLTIRSKKEKLGAGASFKGDESLVAVGFDYSEGIILNETYIYTNKLTDIPLNAFTGTQIKNIVLDKEKQTIPADMLQENRNIRYEGELKDWLKIKIIKEKEEE